MVVAIVATILVPEGAGIWWSAAAGVAGAAAGDQIGAAIEGRSEGGNPAHGQSTYRRPVPPANLPAPAATLNGNSLRGPPSVPSPQAVTYPTPISIPGLFEGIDNFLVPSAFADLGRFYNPVPKMPLPQPIPEGGINPRQPGPIFHFPVEYPVPELGPALQVKMVPSPTPSVPDLAAPKRGIGYKIKEIIFGLMLLFTGKKDPRRRPPNDPQEGRPRYGQEYDPNSDPNRPKMYGPPDS